MARDWGHSRPFPPPFGLYGIQSHGDDSVPECSDLRLNERKPFLRTQGTKRESIDRHFALIISLPSGIVQQYTVCLLSHHNSPGGDFGHAILVGKLVRRLQDERTEQGRSNVSSSKGTLKHPVLDLHLVC